MQTSTIFRSVLLSLMAALTVSVITGCASHNAASQAPSGMKVGGPLTAAQIHAIQQKRQGNGSPPVQ